MAGIVRFLVSKARNYFSERDTWDTLMMALQAHESTIEANHFCMWEAPFVGQTLSLAIVEPRRHPHLRTVLYNVAKLYANSGVSLFIFHGTENETFVLDIVAEWPNVHLINLGVANLRPLQEYSQLLSSAHFYDWFKSEFVLIFQTDVLLRRKISEQWFQYDYVGAPCRDGTTLNGGLSLRRVPFFKKVLASDTWQVNMAEDIWWSNMCRKYHGTCPTMEDAKGFSVEALYSEDPDGLHQIFQYQNVSRILALTKVLLPTVVATLTVLPKRLESLRTVLESLRPQVSWIELNIPKICRRTQQAYDIPSWLLSMPYVDVYEVDQDYGPLTKVWPTLDRQHSFDEYGQHDQERSRLMSTHGIERHTRPEYFFVVDDDKIYRPTSVIEALAEFKLGLVIGLSGASLKGLESSLYQRLTPVEGPCHIVQGFSGYLFRNGTFSKMPIDLVLHNEDLYKCDDLVVSNWFWQNGFCLWSTNQRQKDGLPETDALSFEENYAKRLIRATQELKRRGLWHIPDLEP
jgi:hypothetical protein